MSSTFYPMNDNVIIKPFKRSETTELGLVLVSYDKDEPRRGLVVAAGHGRVNERGNRIELEVATGDVVVYNQYAVSDIKIAGESYQLIKEEDILLVDDEYAFTEDMLEV